MSKKILKIATRQSPLAIWQANHIKQALESLHPELSVELVGITTSADQIINVPLYKVGGKGLFVKELEEALLSGKADIAVHSMKDVPMILPEGLMIAVMSARENPFDAFVSEKYNSLDNLPQQARVGTSSLRRQSQLLARYPALHIEFLRGNVNTRLNKLDEGEFSAIILAVSGLIRLGLNHRIKKIFSANEMLPAAGQGVLGIECREEDIETQNYIKLLDNAIVHACVNAERAVCRALNAGCQAPVAAYAEYLKDQIHLCARVLSLDGKIILQSENNADIFQAEQCGIKVAEDLLAKGARKVLDDCYV